MTEIQSTVAKLHSLHLDNMAEHLPDALNKEKSNNHGFLWLLDYLIATEHEARWKR